MSLSNPPPSLAWPHYGIGFGPAIRRGFTKYATFAGRAGRAEYWWWSLFVTLVVFVLAAAALIVGMKTSPDGGKNPGTPGVILLVVIGLFYLAVLVPSIAVSVRRLHDAGFSGWLVLLGLIPSLGGVILLVFTVLPPSPSGARYDPAPTASGYAPYGGPPYPDPPR